MDIRLEGTLKKVVSTGKLDTSKADLGVIQKVQIILECEPTLAICRLALHTGQLVGVTLDIYQRSLDDLQEEREKGGTS